MQYFNTLLLLVAVPALSLAYESKPAGQLTYGYVGTDVQICTESSLKSCTPYSSGNGGLSRHFSPGTGGALVLGECNRYTQPTCPRSVTVQGGCCVFYCGDKCEGKRKKFVVSETDANKGVLKSADTRGDRVGSWMCSWACAKLPGVGHGL